MNQSTVLVEPETNMDIQFEKITRSKSEREGLNRTIERHPGVLLNLERKEIIKQVIRRKEAILGKQGYLYTVTPAESTGRSPIDTYLVKDTNTESTIDWTSPDNHPLEKETFQHLWEDALNCLSLQKKIYISDRAIGADPNYALPVRIITDSALTRTSRNQKGY